MKLKTLAFTTGLLLILGLKSKANSVIGFWKVIKVSQGDQIITPVAKWFKIKEDNTFQSGNGWTQNSYGTWTFNENEKKYSSNTLNGIKDEFGAFDTYFSGDTLFWERTENEMKVMVSLIPISEMPMALADKILGLWQLVEVKKGNNNQISTYDPKGKQFIFIRPDKRYRVRNSKEKISQGFWHMDGHKPILTLINYDRSIENKLFQIEIKNGALIMKQPANDGLFLIYKRINVYPE